MLKKRKIEGFYNRDEVLEILGISGKTLNEIVNEKRLKKIKFKGIVYFAKEDIENYKQEFGLV